MAKTMEELVTQAEASGNTTASTPPPAAPDVTAVPIPEPPKAGNGKPVPPKRTTTVKADGKQTLEISVKTPTLRKTTPAKEDKVPKPSLKARKILGDSERFKIYKSSDRPPFGDPKLVGNFSLSTIEHAGGDLELFIQHHLMPEYGPGEYVVKAINSLDQVTNQVDIGVLAPRGSKGPGSPIGVRGGDDMNKRLFERYEKVEERLYARMNQPVKSLADQLEDLARIKQLFGDDKQGMAMMMQHYQQQQQQAPTIDPALVREMQAIRAEFAKSGGGGGPRTPLPLPPPEPPIKLGEVAQLMEQFRQPQTSTADMVGIITALLPTIRDIFKPPDNTQMFEMMRDQNNHLREEVKEMRNAPAPGIKETLEELAAAKDVFDKFAGNDTGIAGAIKELVASPAMAGLMQRVTAEEAAMQGQQPQRQIPQHAQPHPQQQPPKPEQPPQPTIKLEPDGFPPGFRVAVETLDRAENNAQRIQLTIQSLQILHPVPQFRPLVTDLLAAAKAGDKDEVRTLLQGYLDDCMEADMLSEDGLEKTMKAFDDHFEAVVETLQKMG